MVCVSGFGGGALGPMMAMVVKAQNRFKLFFMVVPPTEHLLVRARIIYRLFQSIDDYGEIGSFVL